MRWRAFLDSLTLRLFLLTFATILVAFGVHAFVNVRTTSRNWEESVYEGAHRFSELIEDSTHHSMLLNRKEDVHHIIRSIADEPGVEGVRVYDKQGRITFSAREREIGASVDLRAEACVSCHEGPVPLQDVPEDGRFRIFSGPEGGRVLGVINPIENAPECSTAGCHADPAEQSILGVLDVQMSMAGPDARLATVERQAVVAATLTALLAGLVSAAFLVRVVRRPVKHLISGTERIATGDLDTKIEVSSHTELAQLARSFNEMTGDLRRARDELTTWSERLEARLQERTEELGRTQRQVAHMDKMASLGKLAATVAHELNNPLAGILNYAKLVERSVREGETDPAEREELVRFLQLVQKEASRSGNIVRNLLSFARPSGGSFGPHCLNAILDRAVMLVAHRLEMAGVRLEVRKIEGDDRFVCDADQIQQALVALLVNAVEAMCAGDLLSIVAEGREDSIVVSIGDTGTGIREEDLPHVFEPFYSSKDGTEGAGLGLAVVYGIVQRHGGRIDVESELGHGTTFRLSMPRGHDPDGGPEDAARPEPQTMETGHA